MHPLIITPLFPPAVGGAATYFRELTTHLAQRPEIERLTILTERAPGAAAHQRSGKMHVMRLLPQRVSATRHSRLWHSVSYVTTQLWFWRRLRPLVAQQQVDLLHFHTRFRGKLFFASLRKSGVPVVADLRDQMSPVAELIPCTDWLLCCSQGVQQFALAQGFPPQKLTLIPNAYTLQPPPSAAAVAAVCAKFGLAVAPFVLYIGEITPNKGVYELLDAFDQWRQTHADVQLVLAGANRQGDKFLTEVASRTRVVYLNTIAHAEVLSLMRQAQIVILPSRSEGMPTVILEAISMGAKVICPPNIPEFDQHLPDFVLPAVTPTAICTLLEQVWRNPARPSYPLADHRIDQVVDAVLRGYAQILQRTRPVSGHESPTR